MSAVLVIGGDRLGNITELLHGRDTGRFIT